MRYIFLFILLYSNTSFAFLAPVDSVIEIDSIARINVPSANFYGIADCTENSLVTLETDSERTIAKNYSFSSPEHCNKIINAIFEYLETENQVFLELDYNDRTVIRVQK